MRNHAIASSTIPGWNRKSSPVIVSSVPFLDGDELVLQFVGAPGLIYTIKSTPSVAPANWQKTINLVPTMSDTGMGIGGFEFRETAGFAGQKYYRAVFPAY